MFHKLNLLSIP